jgi:hypothetical protein
MDPFVAAGHTAVVDTFPAAEEDMPVVDIPVEDSLVVDSLEEDSLEEGCLEEDSLVEDSLVEDSLEEEPLEEEDTRSPEHVAHPLEVLPSLIAYVLSAVSRSPCSCSSSQPRFQLRYCGNIATFKASLFRKL